MTSKRFGTVVALVGLVVLLLLKPAAAQQGDACWTQVSGAARQIAAADGNYPWVIGTDEYSDGNYGIFFLDSNGVFLQTPGRATDVSAVYSHGYNEAAVTNAAGTWFVANITGGSDYDVTSVPSITWETETYSKPAGSLVLGLDSNGSLLSTIVGLGSGNQDIYWMTDYEVYTTYYNDLANGTGTLIGNVTGYLPDLYPFTAWAVNSGNVWEWTSSNGSSGSWYEIGDVDAISISRSALYANRAPLIVNSTGSIQYWSGFSWEDYDSTTGWLEVDVGNNGTVWAIKASGNAIWKGKDLASDPDNCGSCGTTCPAGGGYCEGGACFCPQNATTDCGGTCTNVQTDPNNCGNCGNVCASGEQCVNGACFVPSGWLYTSGNTINKSTGSSGSQWMGRGVNVDDIFFGGHNSGLTTFTTTQATTNLEAVISGLMSAWKPSFLRVSLYMNSPAFGLTTSWLTGNSTNAEYKTPMTNVINWVGSTYTSPQAYVLVTLRSDASMILEDTLDGVDAEATGVPSNNTNAPSGFPTGTDTAYQALVDSFASSAFVIFGISNEPGGGNFAYHSLEPDAPTLAAAMSHAVGVIRAEENLKGVPHHIVSVQGLTYTQDLSYYSTHPLSNPSGVVYDNVVYEYHGYPPPTTGTLPYVNANFPVIIGEYGPIQSGGGPVDLADWLSFFTSVESNKIPNLAWDFEPWNAEDPANLVNVTYSNTDEPSSWGTTVQSYLLDPSMP
jgi:hypothetical protein